MEDFYREQRRRFDVLMDGDKPVGSRWNYDEENREPPPKSRQTLDVPKPYQPREDDIDKQVSHDLDRMDLPTVGIDGPRLFAVTPNEAKRALDRFIEHRLPTLRPLRGRDHGSGLGDVALAAVRAAQSRRPAPARRRRGRRERLPAARRPLAAVEGFIRQILGWREYMWHLYWHFGPGYTRNNKLLPEPRCPNGGANSTPTPSPPNVSATPLMGVRDRGWTHHIQRLMVLGNHALQRGYRPAELTEWFATAYVDGFRWVMPTNVVGMSQHADGGQLATKPYASGGAYINKMSDHCGDCAYDPKKRLGDDACPFTAGYWSFVHRHRDLLAKNNRTQRAVASMERLKDLDAVLEQEAARRSF